jgi:DNA primase
VNLKPYFEGKSEIPKDPAEILQKFGSEALKKVTKCSILDVDFIISRTKASRKESQSVASLFPYLDALDSEVGRDASIGLIADAFGVERRAVWEDYNRQKETGLRKIAVRSNPEGISSSRGKSLHAGYELYMLGAVFVNSGLFKKLRSGLSLEELEDLHARELYIVLEEWYRETGSFEYARSGELLDRIQDGDVRDFILRQEALGSFNNPEMLIDDGMTRIKIKTLEKKRRELIRKLRNVTNKTSVDGIEKNELPQQDDLLSEKIHIDAELTKLKGKTIIQ